MQIRSHRHCAYTFTYPVAWLISTYRCLHRLTHVSVIDLLITVSSVSTSSTWSTIRRWPCRSRPTPGSATAQSSGTSRSPGERPPKDSYGTGWAGTASWRTEAKLYEHTTRYWLEAIGVTARRALAMATKIEPRRETDATFYVSLLYSKERWIGSLANPVQSFGWAKY